MASRPSRIPGPLFGALAPYLTATGVDAEIEVASVMASLLEFGGSMRLAERLAEPPPRAPRSTPHPGSRPLEARIDRELELLRTRVERAFESVRPRAVSLWNALEDATAWGNPQLTADTLWAPLGEVIGSRIDAVRSTTSEIRHEIAHELRLDPSATHLEALDAVLHEAMHGATQKLCARIVPAMHAVFTRDVNAASSALPDFPRREQLEPWCRRDGCVAKHFWAGRAIVSVLLELEADRLLALAEGCLGSIDS